MVSCVYGYRIRWGCIHNVSGQLYRIHQSTEGGVSMGSVRPCTYWSGLRAEFYSVPEGYRCPCPHRASLCGVRSGTSAVDEEPVALSLVGISNLIAQAFTVLTLAWVVHDCEAVRGRVALFPWSLIEAWRDPAVCRNPSS